MPVSQVPDLILKIFFFHRRSFLLTIINRSKWITESAIIITLFVARKRVHVSLTQCIPIRRHRDQTTNRLLSELFRAHLRPIYSGLLFV